MDGIASGTACPTGVCTRAGEDGQSDDDRRTWLQDTLDESTANNARPTAGLGWLPANWGNFVGTGVGYPKLKYAPVDGYCSDGSDKDEDACEASRSCSVGTHATGELCTTNGGMWTLNAWLAGGDECDASAGGSTGVVCGDTIPGQ